MTQLELFNTKELYLIEHTTSGRSYKLDGLPEKRKRKVLYENMHLMEGMTFTTNLGFPEMRAYTGTTDFYSVPYTERKQHDGHNQALHFFIDDYRFRDAVWYNLEYTTRSISNYDFLFAPDFSQWRDLPTDFYNMENTFRSRFTGSYWQICGGNVIPTAGWGGLSSFAYCFEGLPCNSVIAVSGMGNRRNGDAFNRWRYGLRRLEEEKSPILILVYGEAVEVQGLHTPLKFIPCFISTKLRKL